MSGSLKSTVNEFKSGDMVSVYSLFPYRNFVGNGIFLGGTKERVGNPVQTLDGSYLAINLWRTTYRVLANGQMVVFEDRQYHLEKGWHDETK